MNKVIGLMTAWCAEPFIEPALKQAIEYCDEVIIAVGPHSKELIPYEDGTLDIVSKYLSDTVKLVPVQFEGNHIASKNSTLNKMIEASNNRSVGNWVWLLDIDEFYFREDVDNMKKVMFDGKTNAIVMPDEKFFYVDMKHYLYSPHRYEPPHRLWKITDYDNYFKPLQNWTGQINSTSVVDICIYHYSLLLNPYAKRAFWKTEYDNKNQQIKTDWLENIYLNFQFEEESKWIDRNAKMFGKRTLFMKSDYDTNDGGLFLYDGKHPNYIEDAKLTMIDDFRKLYSEVLV